MKTVMAVYENGVFRPVGPVDLPEHATVLVPLEEGAVDGSLESDEQALPVGAPKKARTWSELMEALQRLRPITSWPEDPVAWQRQMRDEEWPEPDWPESWRKKAIDGEAEAPPRPRNGEAS